MSIRYLYGEEYAQEQDAVLLVNLGSPASPSRADVARYLNVFLMDERIIGLARPLRALLVKGLITPFRAPHSARNYEYIWDESRRSFPLITHTAAIAEGLSRELQIPVAMAMRYGDPEVRTALQALREHTSLRRIIIVPLYPHYARSSFETAVEHVLAEMKSIGIEGSIELDVLPPFYADEGYRRVLAESIRPYLCDEFDRLVVSFHGIPLSHLERGCRAHNGEPHYCSARKEEHSPVEEGRCYRLHTEETYRMLALDLGIDAGKMQLSYQSRLGHHPWMEPYTIDVIRSLGKANAAKILVVCPGFVCDCLETLHEINVENRSVYTEHGGRKFVYIPCLNSSPAFIQVLGDMVARRRAKQEIVHPSTVQGAS